MKGQELTDALKASLAEPAKYRLVSRRKRISEEESRANEGCTLLLGYMTHLNTNDLQVLDDMIRTTLQARGEA